MKEKNNTLGNTLIAVAVIVFVLAGLMYMGAWDNELLGLTRR